MGALAPVFSEIPVGKLPDHRLPAAREAAGSPRLEVAAPIIPSVDLDDWAQLVTNIQTGNPVGMEQLYQKLSTGIRFVLRRQLGGQDVNDHLHDVFLVVVEAIREGGLRDPRGLMAFVRTIAARHTAVSISHQVFNRKGRVGEECISSLPHNSETPEYVANSRQQEAVMQEVLKELSSRDREVLKRFYLEEQDPELICAEMKLTATQFRLLKNRAKDRFSELGHRRIQVNSLSNIRMRISRA